MARRRSRNHQDYQQYTVYDSESKWQAQVAPSTYKEVTEEVVSKYGVAETKTSGRYVSRFPHLRYEQAKEIADRILMDPWFKSRCVYEKPKPGFQAGTEWANVLDAYKVIHRKMRSDNQRWGGMVSWKSLGTKSHSGPVAQLMLCDYTDITTILHELAHIMSGRYAAHGSTFAANNLALIAHYIGPADAAVLRQVYAQDGVEVDELTPYEKMELERRCVAFDGEVA